jgi:hypothetical protein
VGNYQNPPPKEDELSEATQEAPIATDYVERRRSVLNPGVSFDVHITDRAQLSALLDRVVAAIDVYGIQKICCCVLDDEEGRLDINLTCVKPGPAGDALDYLWRNKPAVSLR